MKNNLWKSFVLTLLVLASLIALFYMPRMSIGDTDLRRVNILSEVQRRTAEGKIMAEVVADSIDGFVEKGIDSTAIQVKKLAYVDSIPEGMTAIEDFADVEGINREMDKFYAALNQAGSRPVRVAYYGDSYIEGDIITMDLRGMLQGKYGGRGVGFVEINCVSADFRRSVLTKRSGWNSYHANEKGKGFRNNLQGTAGSYFIPYGTASIELRGQKNNYGALLDTAEVATVFFTPSDGLNVKYAINGGAMTELFADGGEEQIAYVEEVDSTNADSIVYRRRAIPQAQQGVGNIVSKKVKGRIGKFAMNVTGGSGSRFYGVALDGNHGIAVDNFSMRGSGGQYIEAIPQETLQGFAAARPYDLIILHFGLNVASEKQKDYSAYAAKMGNVIEHLRKAYPSASILVVSMGDRDKKGADGMMHTMGGVREMVSYERKMASDHHVAFWNLYEAMGGDGSIAALTAKKLANLDYTHINFAGGRHIAKLLFDTLMNGKENYDNRK